MNWGYGLTMAFCGFALLIGTLVYKATHTKFELVSEKYYDDEIHFQQQIDRARNAAKRTAVTISQDNQAVTLQFPDSLPSGQAWFYYPTNAQHDRHFAIATANGIQRIAKSQLQKGHCWVKLQWKTDTQFYYTEQEFKIN